MGCGASKSVQVAQTDITTKPKPDPSSIDNADGVSEDELMSVQNENPSPLPEKPAPPSSAGEHSAMETTHAERPSPGEAGSRTNSGNDKYAVFEIEMGQRGSSTPAFPPPKRLESLLGAPKVSAEMLAEKQRKVQERKGKELEKRASTRLSKKERLRREILEARQMDLHGTDGGTLTTTTGPSTDGSNHTINLSKIEDEYSGGGYVDGSAEMEVDQTYNMETEIEGNFWDGEGEAPSTSKHPSIAKPRDSEAHTQNTDVVDDAFGNWGSV